MELTARIHPEDVKQIIRDIRQELIDIVRLTIPMSKIEASANSNNSSSIRAGLMTTKEIKQEFGVANPAIVKFRKEGLLHPIRFGPRYYYKRTEIDAIFNGSTKGRTNY